MSKIDFAKPMAVEHSREGEQVREGFLVQASCLGTPSAYLNISRNNVFGNSERVVVSPSQARTLGELLINFSDQEQSDDEPWQMFKIKIPRNTYPIVFQKQRGAVATSDEVDVSVDEYGVTLEQPICEGPRPNNEITLSKVQMESLIRQMVKHNPSFRKQLKMILEETI